MSKVTMDELVDAYLSIRTERERIAALFDEQDKALKSDMSEIEQMMLGVCNEVGADSIKTPQGTVMRSLKERAICNDWNNFKEFVQERGLIDLLERRVHQGNFKEFMAQHQDAGLPPGINLMREFGVTVRKVSK
jgi:hypothetical protein